MSRHNIVGSEAFDRRPRVYIRSLKAGGVRMRNARVDMAFIAGAAAALVIGAAAAVIAFGPMLSAAAG